MTHPNTLSPRFLMFSSFPAIDENHVPGATSSSAPQAVSAGLGAAWMQNIPARRASEDSQHSSGPLPIDAVAPSAPNPERQSAQASPYRRGFGAVIASSLRLQAAIDRAPDPQNAALQAPAASQAIRQNVGSPHALSDALPIHSPTSSLRQRLAMATMSEGMRSVLSSPPSLAPTQAIMHNGLGLGFGDIVPQGLETHTNRVVTESQDLAPGYIARIQASIASHSMTAAVLHTEAHASLQGLASMRLTKSLQETAELQKLTSQLLVTACEEQVIAFAALASASVDHALGRHDITLIDAAYGSSLKLKSLLVTGLEQARALNSAFAQHHLFHGGPIGNTTQQGVVARLDGMLDTASDALTVYAQLRSHTNGNPS